MENQMDENSLVNQIKETEAKILNVEQELALLKVELEHLRQKHADSIVIPWGDEIKKCMRGFDGQLIFTSYEVVLGYFETRYDIIASRKVKNSIITTLSEMFQDGVIGRLESNNIHYYGLRELFADSDSTIVKNDFLLLFEKCRAYVENFEREV